MPENKQPPAASAISRSKHWACSTERGKPSRRKRLVSWCFTMAFFSSFRTTSSGTKPQSITKDADKSLGKPSHTKNIWQVWRRSYTAKTNAKWKRRNYLFPCASQSHCPRMMNWPPLPSSNHQCSNEPSWIHLESWHIGCPCHILVLQPQRPRMAASSNHLQQLQPSAVRPWSPQWVSSLKLQALGLLLRKACRPTKKEEWRVHPEKHKSTMRSHWIYWIVPFMNAWCMRDKTLANDADFSWSLEVCERVKCSKRNPVYIYSKRYTIKTLIDPSSPLSVQAANWWKSIKPALLIDSVLHVLLGAWRRIKHCRGLSTISCKRPSFPFIPAVYHMYSGLSLRPSD